jgi:hypothetical protein
MIERETLMLLATQVEERRKELLESMGAGTAKDFGGYQHACGEVRGYLIIQNMISEALRTHEHEEEKFDSTPTDSVVKNEYHHCNSRQKNSLHFRSSY